MDVLFQESAFDNNLSSLYKKSLSQSIPIRYMIIQNKSGNVTQLSGALSLQDPNLQFISVFQYVRNKITNQPSLTLEEIREDLREISGGEFNDLDIIWIWITVLAQDNKLNDPTLLQQINAYLNSIKEPKQFDSINAVYSEYTNIWKPAFQREVNEDLAVLRKYTENQQELLRTEPVTNSGLRINSAVVYLEYPTEPDVNPLPDIFSSAKNSYLIPFIQYNIEAVKGKDSKAQRYYKIFHGKSSELNPDYGNVLIDTGTFLQDQTIYMGIWIGPPGNDLEEQNQARLSDRKSFQEASISYDPFANKIRVTIDSPRNENINESVMLKRLQAHFPSLGNFSNLSSFSSLGNFSNPDNLELKEAKVSGSFEMFGTDTSEPFFSYLVMNDPIFSAYLFLNDKTKTFPLKKNFEIYYRGTTNKLSKSEVRQKSGALVAAILTQKIIPSGTVISYLDGKGQRITLPLPSDTISVEVTIKRANSRKIAEQFLNVLTRLNRIYLNKGLQIKDRYRAFVPEYDPAKSLEKKMTSGVAVSVSKPTEKIEAQRAPDAIVDPKNTLPIQGNTKLKRLKAYAPDLFKKEYARDCQRPRQPEPVRPENVSFYRSQQIMVDGKVEYREVLEMLNLDETAYYYFICEPAKGVFKHPYPHLKENTDPNKVYPQVPCCFAKRPSIPTASKIHRNTAKKGYRNKGSKPIDSGKEGELEIRMSDFFKPAAASDESEFIRMGIPFGTNSFLHCLFVATQHPEYYASPDQDEYVNQFRQKLFTPGMAQSGTLQPAVAKQELYDFTLDEIQAQATNNEIFFDPLKFYRLIEALFNCTIYVFAQKDRGLDGLKINFLRIPRHKHFHVRPPPNLDHPVVLINLNWSSKTNRLYPHCELIVEKSEFGTRRLFKKKMNRLLYPAYEFVARTLTWQILDSGMDNKKDEVPALTLRENIYSKMNYLTVFGEIPVVAQFIDSAGKARMFALAPEVDPAQNTFTKLRIFVEVPPTAPLNVVEFSPKNISNLLPPPEKVIELFGEPVSITTNTDHTQVIGLWFRMTDLEFGLYCPCANFSLAEFLQNYPEIRQNSELDALTIRIPRSAEAVGESGSPGEKSVTKEVSPLQQFRLLKRSANFISQILKYLYLVDKSPDLNTFLSTYLIGRSPTDTRNSFQIYAQNILKLQRILPVGTSQQILAQLHQQIPSVVVDTGSTGFRIVVNDRKMLEGIIYQLRMFKDQVEGLNISPSKLRELQNYYSDRDDYFFDPDSQFLISSPAEFEAWKNAYILSNSQQKRVLQELRDNIQTSIDKANYSYQTPYIYQQSGNNVVNASADPSLDNFYLIQNVAGSNFDRAIAVALNWKKKMENSGFATDPYQPIDTKYPVHKIYGISPSGKIILNTDNSQGQDNYLEILIYDDQRYAAMLPLS